VFGRARISGLVALVVTASLAATPSAAPGEASARRTASTSHGAVAAAKPNIIFFLADDMATYHLRHMPNTRRHVFARGARFTNFYANVSLCCPSRASLLTGKYAHNTGIGGNAFPDGFHGFHVGDESNRTFAVALRRRAGYTTGLLGKYLNEYPFVESAPRNAVPRTFVPPGWSDWAVPISGQYYGVDYLLNRNGRILRKRGPRDYLGDLLARRALRKIEKNED
jgi:N-acetylglucosamine-6-sulfatase